MALSIEEILSGFDNWNQTSREKYNKEKMIRNVINEIIQEATDEISIQMETKVQQELSNSCNMCDIKATKMNHDKAHTNTTHENLYQSCNQCKNKATTISNLKTHENLINEGKMVLTKG